MISPEINRNGTCSNGYVCEHRWRQVFSMAEFRRVVSGTSVEHWWSKVEEQVAFCRGNKGFIAFNNGDGGDLEETLQTCLEMGIYCDVISGRFVDGKCTGKSVNVGLDGRAHISIKSWEQEGVIAIHVNSKMY